MNKRSYFFCNSKLIFMCCIEVTRKLWVPLFRVYLTQSYIPVSNMIQGMACNGKTSSIYQCYYSIGSNECLKHFMSVTLTLVRSKSSFIIGTCTQSMNIQDQLLKHIMHSSTQTKPFSEKHTKWNIKMKCGTSQMT